MPLCSSNVPTRVQRGPLLRLLATLVTRRRQFNDAIDTADAVVAHTADEAYATDVADAADAAWMTPTSRLRPRCS